MTEDLQPGRNLDALIAEKVMKWNVPLPELCSHGLFCLEHGGFPHYSTDISDAWEMVAKLAPICGDFCQSDGYFILQYADSACHEIGKKCSNLEIEEPEDDTGEDLWKWSAHFHPGHPGADTESAKIFPDYKKSCARGNTAAHAISLAALEIFKPRQKDTSGESQQSDQNDV